MRANRNACLLGCVLEARSEGQAISGLEWFGEVQWRHCTICEEVIHGEPMQDRIEELDALRGLMLVWITWTHLPTVLSAYINQPLGFFSATEGFIFLSALFTGRIYFRIAERNGYGAMWWKLWMRAGKLYCYQLLLLAVAFVIEAPIAAHGNTPAVHNLLDFYFVAGHTRAF